MSNHCIAIMTAMNIEFNYVKKELKIKKSRLEKGFKIATHVLNNSNFILLRTGMGLEKAQRATRFLLDNFNINAIINMGIAGALKPGLNIGDLVLAEDVLFEGNADKSKYKFHFLAQNNMVESMKQRFCAWENTGNMKNKWYYGRIVSVKKLVGTLERKQSLHREFNALAVDMEAAAILETCDNIPFVAIKSISDPADESLGVTDDIMMNNGKINITKILWLFIHHPFYMASRLKAMLKNTKLALANLEFFIREIPAIAETLRKTKYESVQKVK